MDSVRALQHAASPGSGTRRQPQAAQGPTGLPTTERSHENDLRGLAKLPISRDAKFRGSSQDTSIISARRRSPSWDIDDTIRGSYG